MKLRTELDLKSYTPKINRQDKILLMGSCFSFHIGEKLRQYKFDLMNNPFGTIYNPIAICHLLNTASYHRSWPGSLFLENQGIHRHYWTHSDMAATSLEELKKKLEILNDKFSAFIKETKWVIFTMGTSIAYELPHGEIVANCHKMPSKTFKRRYMTCDEIVEWCMNSFNIIESINPGVQFLLTVSPVRHLKEGIESNQISKSIIQLACHKLTEKKTNLKYFPSYELMMDDLRDYRYYKSDMAHPNDIAVDYIWDRFKTALIDNDSLIWMRRWEKIIKALQHRPFFPGTPQHQRFVKKTLRQLEAFSKEVDISEEKQILKQQLI
jgi:hypothetical protein